MGAERMWYSDREEDAPVRELRVERRAGTCRLARLRKSEFHEREDRQKG